MSKKEVEVSQVSTADSLELTDETIRQRAYELFEQRRFEHGHDLDDWLQAEAELTAKKPSNRADLDTQSRKAAAA